jgi:hypothetical protein
VALAHLLNPTCFCDPNFFVYTWIIIFQWIAMWQHHLLLWQCSRKDIEVLKEATPSFYLINMTTTVATNWCHALTEFLVTALHLIQFPLRSSSMEFSTVIIPIDATVTTQELHPYMHCYGRCYVCSLARRSLPHFGVLLHKTTVAVALMHLNWRTIHASARYSQIIPVRTLLLIRSDDK